MTRSRIYVKKTRSLGVLYSILYDHLVERYNNKEFYPGVCWNIDNLRKFKKITGIEYQKLLYTFKNNYPHYYKHSEFTAHSSFKDAPFAYWWTCNEEGFEQRLLFIEKLKNHYSKPWWERMFFKN